MPAAWPTRPPAALPPALPPGSPPTTRHRRPLRHRHPNPLPGSDPSLTGGEASLPHRHASPNSFDAALSIRIQFLASKCLIFQSHWKPAVQPHRNGASTQIMRCGSVLVAMTTADDPATVGNLVALQRSCAWRQWRTPRRVLAFALLLPRLIAGGVVTGDGRCHELSVGMRRRSEAGSWPWHACRSGRAMKDGSSPGYEMHFEGSKHTAGGRQLRRCLRSRVHTVISVSLRRTSAL